MNTGIDVLTADRMMDVQTTSDELIRRFAGRPKPDMSATLLLSYYRAMGGTSPDLCRAFMRRGSAVLSDLLTQLHTPNLDLSAPVWDRFPVEPGDSCAEFFGATLRAMQPDLPETASVLELGCAEYNWLSVAERCWPSMTFTGIDWRALRDSHPTDRITVRKGDLRDPSLCAPNSQDWIVAISAIEHVGLGHYDNDPLDRAGDIAAIANAWTWLKPGGWLYFDVPFNPQGFRVVGTSHREYGYMDIVDRFWVSAVARASAIVKWKGTYFSHAYTPSTLIERPGRPTDPYYYIGLWWQKVADNSSPPTGTR
jgi:SAM-dependent methyltransferase